MKFRVFFMIKVHVTPITPKHIFLKYMLNESVLINYLNPADYNRAVKVCSNIYIDNGAYGFYLKGIKPNYNDFYKWLEGKTFNHFFVPDIINGTEEENDNLIKLVPEKFKIKAIPVFHIHESFDRLKRLISEFDYIALGSSGDYWDVGSVAWFNRMNLLMEILCYPDGTPKVKIHMLRCLNPKVFIHFPFYSADSSNLAQNHSKRGIEKMLNDLKCFDAPLKYRFVKQLSFFD